MKQTFAIGIPTLNRADLLLPSLLFYLRDYPENHIYVVDNGNQNIKSRFGLPSNRLHIIHSDKNLGVSGSWNMLCAMIFENNSHALIMNDDIYLGRDYLDVMELIKKSKGFTRSTQDWCAFILENKTFEKVGKFDESFFPAYYEDNDYEYRLRLLGIPVKLDPLLNPYMYRSNSTSDKEPSVKNFIETNKRYYVNKWGGLPKKETYTKPFNPK